MIGIDHSRSRFFVEIERNDESGAKNSQDCVLLTPSCFIPKTGKSIETGVPPLKLASNGFQRSAELVLKSIVCSVLISNSTVTLSGEKDHSELANQRVTLR